MKVLLTGICGYVGSRLAARFADALPGLELIGLDNLSRRGAETNLPRLQERGARLYRGDLRLASDVGALPAADWVVDCAANPAVLAGIDSTSGCTCRQLMEHNLVGTLHLLEYCRQHRAGLVLLSSSRVYSIAALSRVPLREAETRLEPVPPIPADLPGFSERGVAEDFPTTAPISLYGATKLASEILALEYGLAFDFPVWINRCGVIGGPGQFGRIDQGIFSFWVYSCALGRPLRYIGFGGTGKQVRDCVLAEDVADLVLKQLADPRPDAPRVLNVGGGLQGALSLRELTTICERELGCAVEIGSTPQTRPFDIPYYVTDTRLAGDTWGWRPGRTAEQIVVALCKWTQDNLAFVRELLG